jgi:hypothetical protein
MVHLARGAAYRARQDDREGRFGWLVSIVALNLLLWSVLNALIARAG